MTKLDITGTWTGEYWYFPNPVFPILPPRTSFSLVALQRGCLGRFSGTVQDARVAGVLQEEAAIGGRVAGNRIRFWKQYASYYVWMEDRLVTLGEEIRANLEITLDEEPQTAPIRYRGKYVPEEGYAEGTWEFPTYGLQCWSDGRSFDILMPGCAGAWRMARQSG